MLSSLDKGMKEIQAANGDFSSKIVEKLWLVDGMET